MLIEDDKTTKLYRAEVLLQPSDVCALNTTPIPLLPAVPGHAIMVEYGTLHRTGARYATNGGNIQVRILNSTLRVPLQLAGGVLTADDTPPVTDFRWRDLSVVGFISDWPNSLGSKALDVWSAANATVDATNVGSPVLLVIWYRLVPGTVAGL